MTKNSDGVFLLGDFGGTNARLALSTPNGVADIDVYQCANFDGPASIVRQYLDEREIPKADRAIIGIAGPADDAANVIFTNGPWKQKNINFTAIDADEVHTLNDFAAVCYSVASLTPRDCEIIVDGENPFFPSAILGGGKLTVNKTQLLSSDPAKRFVTIGPGTGLGVSTGLVTEDGQFLVLGGEGSHAAFAPDTAEEMELMEYLVSTDRTVTMETIASGTGLALTFNAFCEIRDLRVSITDASELPHQLSIDKPKPIREAARATLKLFADTLGRSAASAALTNNASTVFVAGGVIPKLGDLFYKNAFAKAFRDNDLGSNNILQKVPVVQIKHPQPGLLGAHSFLTLNR